MVSPFRTLHTLIHIISYYKNISTCFFSFVYTYAVCFCEIRDCFCKLFCRLFNFIREIHIPLPRFQNICSPKRLILNKKLGELRNKLSARHVEMELSLEAYKHLLKLGFTKEYGAREMDRAIASHLKPLLMREILFGTLKTGGKVEVTAENGQLSLQVLKKQQA